MIWKGIWKRVLYYDWDARKLSANEVIAPLDKEERESLLALIIGIVAILTPVILGTVGVLWE